MKSDFFSNESKNLRLGCWLSPVVTSVSTVDTCHRMGDPFQWILCGTHVPLLCHSVFIIRPSVLTWSGHKIHGPGSCFVVNPLTRSSTEFVGCDFGPPLTRSSTEFVGCSVMRPDLGFSHSKPIFFLFFACSFIFFISFLYIHLKYMLEYYCYKKIIFLFHLLNFYFNALLVNLKLIIVSIYRICLRYHKWFDRIWKYVGSGNLKEQWAHEIIWREIKWFYRI